MKSIGNKIYKIIDVLIVLIIILSTRSVYAHIKFDFHFNILLILVLLIYFIIKLINKEIIINDKKTILALLGGYYAFLTIFFIFNDVKDVSNFISSYVIILPLLIFKIVSEKNKNNAIEMLKIYSNIVLILAIISLFMYLIGPITQIVKPDELYLNWGNGRAIKSYLNIHFKIQSAHIMNANLIRNTGIFTEAPMFCLHLVIALAVQLFISNKTKRPRVFILLLVTLSTYSAIGIIIASILIISKYILHDMNNKKTKNNRKLFILKRVISLSICTILIVLSVYMFHERMNKSESLFVRTDDYKASFNAWKEKPIFGIGYLNSDEIESKMDVKRIHNKGISNSLMTTLAQNGIYFFITYLIGFGFTTYYFIKEKNYNYLLFNITLLLLFITSIFTYTQLMIFILAVQYVYLIRKKNKDNYNSDTTLYVITHKKIKCPRIQGYIPLHVGKEGKEDLGYQGDNSGDNISSKNSNYCELTGIYWLWKNGKENKNVGIVHYRRYFVDDYLHNNDLIQIEKVDEILKNYDIILPKKEIYDRTAIEQYCRSSGMKSDLDKVREIIERDYPDYLNAYDKVLNNNKMYQYNMLICKKERFDEYCKWLFDILFKLEENIDLKERNDYQKRIYGFLSERLLNVWVEKNDLKVKELNVINTEEKLLQTLKIKLRRIKNQIEFDRVKKV